MELPYHAVWHPLAKCRTSQTCQLRSTGISRALIGNKNKFLLVPVTPVTCHWSHQSRREKCITSYTQRSINVSLCHPFISLCHPFISLCHPFISLCHPFISLCHPFISLCHPFISLCHPFNCTVILRNCPVLMFTH